MHSVARPWVLYVRSPMTHLVYLLPTLGYLTDSARPSDPDAITNTVVEATASSSGTTVDVEVGIGPFDSPPMSFLLVPH